MSSSSGNLLVGIFTFATIIIIFLFASYSLPPVEAVRWPANRMHRIGSTTLTGTTNGYVTRAINAYDDPEKFAVFGTCYNTFGGYINKLNLATMTVVASYQISPLSCITWLTTNGATY